MLTVYRRFTLVELDEFLSQRCDLASFLDFLVARPRGDFSAVSAKGVATALQLEAPASVSAAVLWGAARLLGDGSLLSGVAQMARMLNDYRDAHAVLHVAAVLVYGLPCKTSSPSPSFSFSQSIVSAVWLFPFCSRC